MNDIRSAMSRTTGVDVVASLFLSFYSGFPFKNEEKIFSPCLMKSGFYILLYTSFIWGTYLKFKYVPIPFKDIFKKVVYFAGDFCHCCAFMLSLLSLFMGRWFVNKPFVHFRHALAKLAQAGFKPTIYNPPFINFFSLFVSFAAILPELYMIIDFQESFLLFSLLFKSVSYIIFYQLLLRVVAMFWIIRRVLSFLIINLIAVQKKTKCSKARNGDLLISLVSAYSHLSSSSFYFNELFSTLLLVTFSIMFISSTVACFFVIKELSDGGIPMGYIYSRTFQIITVIILTTIIVNTFSNCSTEAKEFNLVLQEIMVNNRTNEILNDPKLRLHIAMEQNLVFTAWGFFNLDKSLLHSMISSATTYLVILIQFGGTSGPLLSTT